MGRPGGLEKATAHKNGTIRIGCIEGVTITWKLHGDGGVVAGGKTVIVTGNRDVNAKALR